MADTSFARQERPDALFIGLPPSYHGSIDDPKADIELQLAKARHRCSSKETEIWTMPKYSRIQDGLGRNDLCTVFA